MTYRRKWDRRISTWVDYDGPERRKRIIDRREKRNDIDMKIIIGIIFTIVFFIVVNLNLII